MNEKSELLGPLAYWLSLGKLDARVVLPALRDLTADRPKPLPELLEALEGATDDSLVALAGYLRLALRKEARRVYQARRQNLPLGEREMFGGLPVDTVDEWSAGTDPSATVTSAVLMTRDLAYLAPWQEQVPVLFHHVQQESARAMIGAGTAVMALAGRLPAAWLERVAEAWADDAPGRAPVMELLDERRKDLRNRWLAQAGRVIHDLSPADDPDAADGTLAARFAAAGNRGAKARLLDLACCWMTPDTVPALLEMTGDPWAQDRVIWNLTLRFGLPSWENWESWQRWLGEQHAARQAVLSGFATLIDRHAAGLLLALYLQLPDPDPAVLDTLVGNLAAAEPPVDPAGLLGRWPAPPHERAVLGDAGGLAPLPAGSLEPVLQGWVSAGRVPLRPPPLPAVTPPPLPPAESRPVAAPVQRAVATMAPPPPKPTAWEVHIQPFLVENWYIVAGIAMVIIGCSLLAYYTWDKHWLVRYTLMPLLLGGATWALAAVADWIERRSTEFTGTAAILRTAAIGLLPVNFMAMALLSGDDRVTHKVPALLAMAAIYLIVFGRGLRKWCAAVDPALGNMLGGALLWLNALVAVGPLARTAGHLDGQSLWLCMGAGFYTGFAATAATLVHFTNRILTRQMADDKRVPWFVAGALAITFAEVFIWVHGFMRHLPQATTYALMVVLTGWLVLHAERRALQLKENPQLHGGESFLGFGLILLGLLMGFGDPLTRIAVFLTAGAVWMFQGLRRRHPLHDWIALTLMGLGIAAVGLHPRYPGPWLPLLGLALAGSYGIGGWLCRKHAPRLERMADGLEDPAEGSMQPLADACWGMQMVVLVITALLAPLVQWHFGCEPIGTAACLLLVAAVFVWRALRAQQVDGMHVAMAILALALPYVGMMDIAGRSAHHNTMGFGLAILSWLWLGANRITRNPLLRQARSSVVLLYGILALAAMTLRVLLGDAAVGSPWYRTCMDFSGPILMALALIPTTYHSRSLVPAGIAVVIMAVLFPELKSQLEANVSWISWGSGLESAIWGLSLIGLCFLLRPWGFLRDLPDGDLFGGRQPFPCRRHDHTLFCWPVMFGAVYLIAKVDSWNAIHNLVDGQLPVKTALALATTGVAWTFAAIYHRHHRNAVIGVHLGWLCLLAALACGSWHYRPDPHWTWVALAMGLLLQGLYWLYRYRLESAKPWVSALLTEPTREVLLVGSAALAVLRIGLLLDGAALDGLLDGFLLAQLLWHGLRSRQCLWGVLVFCQIWVGLLACAAGGGGPLWLRVSVANSLTPTLGFLLAIQGLVLALEWLPWQTTAAISDKSGAVPACGMQGKGFGYVAPVMAPGFVLATAMAVLLGLAGLVDGGLELRFSGGQQLLLLGTLLLTARAQACNFILLQAFLLAYLAIHRGSLAAAGIPDARLVLLASPWRLALLGLGITVLTQAGRCLFRRKPGWLAGPFALPAFTAPSCDWLFLPAVVFAGAAAFYQTADPLLRECGVQLWAPYLGAVTFALVARFRKTAGFFAGAGFLLVLGNIHLARVFGGGWARGHGLAEPHLACLGLGISLLQASVLRRVIRSAAAVAVINRTCLGLAGMILTLLSANYCSAPELAGISATRFVVSGALAWLASWYFRRAARHPGPGEEAHTDLCESLYHFGLVLMFWCAAMLVPCFRQPLLALVALGLPVLWFYGRAEFGTSRGRVEARRYRNSAAVLGFFVLGLYVFKAVFQMVLFPGTPIGTTYYHINAPLIFLLGLVLLRLHGLGGTGWLAFYGGLALMCGSYFMLTALPDLTPFERPMAGAWCALGLGHFWIVLSHARSPLRTVIQRLAGLDDGSWDAQRRAWGRCLLAATQGATAWGLVNYQDNSLMVAPLLAGAATIPIHLGIIRRSHIYQLFAGLELVAALHMDFLIPSYLPARDIIWVLLALWLVLLAAYQWGRGMARAESVAGLAAVLGGLVMAHVLYQRPWSPVGLWAMGIGTLLAAWTPMVARTTRESTAPGEVPWGKAIAGMLLGVPVWLVYFSQAPFAVMGPLAAVEACPVLASTLAVMLIGLAGRGMQRAQPPYDTTVVRSQRRLFWLTLEWLETSGLRIHQATVWIATLAVGAVAATHYQSAFAPREIILLAALEAALAVAWYFQGRDRQSMAAHWLMQLCAAACFASIRRQLMLTTDWWNYEYDIWASLAVSFGIGGVQQILDEQGRSLRVPLLTTLVVLPVIALIWVVVHGLGVDLALIVMGLHSVLFVYLGRDRRDSPYHILAMAGFIGFILLSFYSKLHLRALHAYIIPAGLGVLVLQELFKKRIPPDAANGIRLVVLMAMLGSSGYYALADPSHAITFNLTMILLCLAAMALGSVLRIRLYLALGFAGLLTVLVSLLYKVLALMDRSARMTIVGGLVLFIGVLLVVGAIYYKTHKAQLDSLLDRWRSKLASWQ